MRIFTSILGLFLLNQAAFSAECSSGTFVVFSADSQSQTAMVQVIGERTFETLNRAECLEQDDGTVRCEYSGEKYSLIFTEKSGKPSNLRLFGCQ